MIRLLGLPKKKEKTSNASETRKMIEIIRSQSGAKAEPKKEAPEKTTPPKEQQKKKFHLRGILYKKIKKEEKPPSSRAGQLLRLVKRARKAKYPKFEVIPSKRLIPLSARKEVKTKGMLYPLIKPYTYANIKWDPSENTLIYNVIEPEMDDSEKEMLKKIEDGLIQVINISLEDIRKQENVLDFLEENVRSLLDDYDYHLNDQEYYKLMYYIFRNFIGLNEIEPMLRDPYIEDIGMDGVNVPIYVVHQKYGSLKTNVMFKSEETAREFITKLAERCDRYISYAEPLLDGALPDGTRINASLAGDVTTRGPTFSIRKFRDVPFTPVDMVRLNTASAEMLAYLWFVVENGANILITGGVATGKTSFLNTLSLFIHPDSKVVSIEDTRELSLPHENWIPGVARSGFTGTGIGEVSLFDLLKESFRQNPDYLIVGEIRGKEAYVMFQSMASGHPSMSTMHAGSIDDVIRRLQTEPINLSPGLLDTLDLVIVMVHAREKGKSARRVKEVVEMESIDPETGRARTSKAFTWIPSTDTLEYRGSSWLLNKISTEKGIPMDKIIKEITVRKNVINWMLENNIVDLKDIVKYVELLYRSPASIDRLLKNRI